MNTDTLLRVLTAAPQESPMPEGPVRWTQVSEFISLALSAAIIGAAVLILLKLWRQKMPLLGKAAHTDSLRQRREADDRAEWIRRTQWALGAAASANDTMYTFGITILEALARSDLTGPEDKSILDSVWAESYTKMRDVDVRQLIVECKGVIEREEDASTPGKETSRAPDGNEATRQGRVGNSKGFDPLKRDKILATLRREILAARLKVTLDEQLARETSPTVKRLAGMNLPPIARPHRRGGSEGDPAEPAHSSD